MIEPLDHSRRDSTLFQFTTRQLRDFIDPNHLLIRVDEQLDFAKLWWSHWKTATVPTSEGRRSIPRCEFTRSLTRLCHGH